MKRYSILLIWLFLAACSSPRDHSQPVVQPKESMLVTGMPFAEAESKLKSYGAKPTMFAVMLSQRAYRQGKELHYYWLRSGACLEIVSAPGREGRTVDYLAINTYLPKSYDSKMDPEYSKFHSSFEPCTEYDLTKQPDQALLPASMSVTPRADARGAPATLGADH